MHKSRLSLAVGGSAARANAEVLKLAPSTCEELRPHLAVRADQRGQLI